MTTDYRVHLKPYEHQWVKVSGYYETASVGHLPHNRTAMVKDCIVEANDGTKLDVHHVWVQYASEIIELNPQKGQLVYFDAVVNKYQKKDAATGQFSDAWSLSKPINCELESNREPYRTPLLPPPVTAVPLTVKVPEAASPLKVLKAVKVLTASVEAGTFLSILPHLDAINEAVKLAGGAAALAEILELLA